MSKLLTIGVLAAIIMQIVFGRIIIRSKRELEREDGIANESTVVVSGDRESDQFDNREPFNPNTDVMEVDFDQQDGTFSFGGRFPAFPNSNFHQAMNTLFKQMTQRFEDMAKNMANRFHNASSEYPANYNGTKEEVVSIDGKQYIKKVHVIKKFNDNTQIFLSSTTYEPVDEKANES